MSVYFVANIPFGKNELYHHGIKGQQWGVRRYQNEDGSLTEEGRNRYTSDRVYKNNVYNNAKSAIKAKGDKWVPKNKSFKDWYTGDKYKTTANNYYSRSSGLDDMSRKSVDIAYNQHLDKSHPLYGKRSKDGIMTYYDDDGENKYAKVPGMSSWELQALTYGKESGLQREIGDHLMELYEKSPKQVIDRNIEKGKNFIDDVIDKLTSWSQETINAGKAFLIKLLHL